MKGMCNVKQSQLTVVTANREWQSPVCFYFRSTPVYQQTQKAEISLNIAEVNWIQRLLEPSLILPILTITGAKFLRPFPLNCIKYLI